jgi:hypothetical protein
MQSTDRGIDLQPLAIAQLTPSFSTRRKKANEFNGGIVKVSTTVGVLGRYWVAEHIGLATAPLGASVSVANGQVTLSGISCSGGLRRRVETIAHKVAGVTQIDNRIVSVPSHGRL